MYLHNCYIILLYDDYVMLRIMSISKCYGEKSGFKSRIEKYPTLSRIDGEGMKALAYQTARGRVSDFLTRRISDGAFQGETWGQFRVNLVRKFV